MTQIKSLTFDIGDMKEAACKALESCMAYITAYDNTDNEFEAKQAAMWSCRTLRQDVVVGKAN